MKHNLIREAFNVHLKHHVLESLLNVLDVLGNVETARLVIFEGLNCLASSNSKVYHRTLPIDTILVLIKDWKWLRQFELE